MIKAFVFGKFSPFHKGHEAMIHFALGQCDSLSVLICCSDQESIPCTVRKAWLEKTFENIENIEIKTFNYLERELPNTSVPAEEVSAIWANIFIKLFPDHSLVVTSEPYGKFVATFMGIQHLNFDISKTRFPISATAIRNDLFSNWNYLPNCVKPYFTIKIAILGSESTGKTILAQKLAQHFNCTLVPETAREFIADSTIFTLEDLNLVASEHAKQIEKACEGESALVIIDTDIHITKSYAQFALNKELEVNPDIYNINMAHLYLYLCNDAPYIQDGTRLNELERNLLDGSHRKLLAQHNIEIVEIAGNWQQRFEKAVISINQLLSINKRRCL